MGKTIKLLGLGFVALLMLYPTWLMISMSFSPSIGFLSLPPKLFPFDFTLRNYQAIFRLPQISRWILNSVLVTSTVLTGGVLASGSAAYVFRVGTAKWLKPVFWALMMPIFVTRMILIVGQAQVAGKLQIIGLPAVLVFTMFWATGVFLFRNFFNTIPEAFLDSARMDGAGDWMIFFRVVLPLSKPMVGVSVVFLGMGALGDFLWQAINLTRAKSQTLLVGLINSSVDVRVVENVGYDLAVGTCLFIPLILIFAGSSRYFQKGLTMGGLRE